jgi:hypothetical protein
MFATTFVTSDYPFAPLHSPPYQNGNAQRGERMHMELTMDKYDLTNNKSKIAKTKK